MFHSLKLLMLGAGFLLLPCALFSMEVTDNHSADLSKEMWIEQVKASSAAPICKSFMEDTSIAVQMTAHHISYEQCLSLVSTISETCVNKYSNEFPAIIDDLNADKWGRVLGECIGNDFAKRYLYTN